MARPQSPPSLLARAFRLYHTLSLDVLLGAAGTASLYAVALGVQPAWWQWALLLLGVWCFYTLDHLLDARRIKTPASNPRHRFFQRHYQPLLVAFVLALLAAGLITLLYINAPTLLLGLAVGGVAVLHIGLVQLVGGRISRSLQKELGVALVYALGCAVPAYAAAHELLPAFSLDLANAISVLSVLFVALINLLLYSFFELETDATDGQTSLMRALGPRAGLSLLQMLAYFAAAITLGWWLLNPGLAPWALLLVLACQVVCVALRRFTRQHERYRLLAEGGFALPLLLWLVV